VTIEIETLELWVDDSLIDDSAAWNIVSWLASLGVLLSQCKSSIVTLLNDHEDHSDGREDNIPEGASDEGNFNLRDAAELSF